MTAQYPNKVAVENLRWSCDESFFNFETTDQIQSKSEILGQSAAREALLFGMQCDAPGQNIYVRGGRATGRLRMVLQLLDELAMTTEHKNDYSYVHNFAQPDRPRLVVLPAGHAHGFKRHVAEFAGFIDNELLKALDAEPLSSQRSRLKERYENEIAALTKPLEQDLAKNNMGLVSMQQGPMTVPAIFPLVDGQPVPMEQLRELVRQGKADAAQIENFESLIPAFQKKLKKLGKQVTEIFQSGSAEVDNFNQTAARQLLMELAAPILKRFQGRGVKEFIKEVVEDAVENQLAPRKEGVDLSELYGVNIVLANTDPTVRPVVQEISPTIMNLLGSVEPKWGPEGVPVSDYRGIRAGALLNADRGYLILTCEDLVSEPGAYRALMRTLRTRRLEIVPPEVGWMRPHVVIQPEPIPINVRVILIGDISTYYHLDYLDSDFRELFKVLADFDSQLVRDEQGMQQYAAVVAQLAHQENLIPLHRSAVAALTEHGARIASRKGKLTARFGRIGDIACEASHLAQQAESSVIEATHVEQAVHRTRHRASLPSRKFQELVENGTILLQTQGQVAGQINGLAVMTAGPLTYGFPCRITATIGPGRAGLINIEGSAQMSGSIHTKGFHILGGLLRTLLQLPHPMAFSASIAFEQSYGGIDGDSASGAEMVCLLSALTGIAIRQNLAMTGAIDQHGNIEAIGGVNEKIEGFYDACKHFGLTGDQGVVIPHSNAGDLMLRKDVVADCARGNFNVFTAKTIHDAIELFTGIPAGDLSDGEYPKDSVLNLAVQKAHDYWRRTLASPDKLTSVLHEEVESGNSPDLPGTGN